MPGRSPEPNNPRNLRNLWNVAALLSFQLNNPRNLRNLRTVYTPCFCYPWSKRLTNPKYCTNPLAYSLQQCCEVLELPFEKGSKDAEVGIQAIRRSHRFPQIFKNRTSYIRSEVKLISRYANPLTAHQQIWLQPNYLLTIFITNTVA